LNQRQIQTIHNLGGDRNANRILNDMAEYLSSFRNEDKQKVYYLNKAGRERVGAEKVRSKTMNVQHFLLRNQLWIAMRKPSTWQNEVKVTVKDISIVSDARFLTGEKRDVLVEVDISQPMNINKQKIDKYRRIKELTGNEFHIVWVTELESRKPKLQELMSGLPGRVFTAKEII
jgi:hypothetical protein